MRPVISVVMPVYNPREDFLRAAIESVRRQLYPHWELCIADDASTAPLARRVLEEYQAQDPRIKVCYRAENGHISEASNSALALATGEFIALLDQDDVLTEQALYRVAVEIAEHPGDGAGLLRRGQDRRRPAALRSLSQAGLELSAVAVAELHQPSGRVPDRGGAGAGRVSARLRRKPGLRSGAAGDRAGTAAGHSPHSGDSLPLAGRGGLHRA
ncbi:MAG: glycosyltransferase [Desulfobacterales bacterium]|nr:glycosyltransferase [Desulfobacterales bacterium]